MNQDQENMMAMIDTLLYLLTGVGIHGDVITSDQINEIRKTIKEMRHDTNDTCDNSPSLALHWNGPSGP